MTLLLLPLLLPEAAFSVRQEGYRRRKRSVWKPSVVESLDHFIDVQEVLLYVHWLCSLQLFVNSGMTASIVVDYKLVIYI